MTLNKLETAMLKMVTAFLKVDEHGMSPLRATLGFTVLILILGIVGTMDVEAMQ